MGVSQEESPGGRVRLRDKKERPSNRAHVPLMWIFKLRRAISGQKGNHSHGDHVIGLGSLFDYETCTAQIGWRLAGWAWQMDESAWPAADTQQKPRYLTYTEAFSPAKLVMGKYEVRATRRTPRMGTISESALINILRVYNG